MKRMPPVALGLASLLVLLALGAGGFALWSAGRPQPTAVFEGASPHLGIRPAALALVVGVPSGRLASLEVRIAQAGKEQSLLSESGLHETADGSGPIRREIMVDASALGLEEGLAEIRVFATDDRWRPSQDASARLIQSVEVDLTPPGIEYRAATKYIKHSGSGVVAWRAKGATRSFVRCGTRDFPGTAGLSNDPDVLVALFTVPYLDAPREPVIHAQDQAGNERTLSVPVVFLPSDDTRDTVKLNDDFMRRKVGELNPRSTATEGAELLEAFRVINKELRAENEARNRELGLSASEPVPLFAGAFRQQPNSKVFARFPQERDYKREGQIVDTAWHLGLDLASNAGSSILASGAGKVLFVGDNGIYGNMVMLDHGLGLTSLYAHLSEIGVAAGQSVAQGESLGRSGMTGLAAGDHLHFAMLIHGTYTNPIDWFDAKYIADRISGPLLEAGLSLPGLTDITPPAKPVKAVKKASRRR